MAPPNPPQTGGNKKDKRGKMRTLPRSTPVLGMLNMLAVTEEGEIACNQVFAALGEVAELA